MEKTPRKAWQLQPLTFQFWHCLLFGLEDIDSLVTILLYHLPSIFVTLATAIDATVFPVYWFTLYHLIGHGEWIRTLSLVGSFWLPLIPKYWVGRHRPLVTMNWRVRGGDGFKGADKGSFPSGHACFLAATFTNLHHSLLLNGHHLLRHEALDLGSLCGNGFIFYGPLLVWFLYASLARVIVGAHWFGDVVCGWLMGYAWCHLWWWASSAVLSLISL